jgi:lipopolysaccharide heptosyltransferase I
MKKLSLEEIDRLLLVRLSAVGDIIHALPVLRALKKRRPSLKVSWLVEDRFACLLRGIEDLEEVLEVPRGRWRSNKSTPAMLREAYGLCRELARRNFDASIDLQGLTKSGLWPFLARVPVRVGFGDEDGRELNRYLTNAHVTPAADQPHVVHRNLSLLRAFGMEQPEVEFGLPRDEQSASRVQQMLGELSGPLALLQPGAGWPTKRWPVEHFAAIGDRLEENSGFQVVALWGPGEEELAEGIVSHMNRPARVAPPTSLKEMIELIRSSSLMVGGDTGPMHIASALGIPVVAVYGASDPVRNGPCGGPNLVLHSQAECHPCWKTRCNNIHCLTELSPEELWPRIETFVQQIM